MKPIVLIVASLIALIILLKFIKGTFNFQLSARIGMSLCCFSRQWGILCFQREIVPCKDIGEEVAGIKMLQDNTKAIVEYTTKYTRTSPFIALTKIDPEKAESKSVHEGPAKAGVGDSLDNVLSVIISQLLCQFV